MSLDRCKYLDAREVEQLRRRTQATGGLPWLVVDLALSTGLRVSELCRIRVEDVDLARNAVRITRSKKRGKAKPETLAISPALGAHIAEYLMRKRTQGDALMPSDHLFTGKRGPLTVRGAQHVWKKAVKLAGLPSNLGIHSARHTLATHLLKTTGNLSMVQKILGHESPATTSNLYCGIAFDDQQKALAKVYA